MEKEDLAATVRVYDDSFDTEVYEFTPRNQDQFDLQLEHLCDAIEKGTLFRIEPEFSLGNMRVLDAIRDSIHTSAPVDVPTLR